MLSMGLVALGLALIVVGVVQSIVDRPAPVTPAEIAPPSIQVRARLAGIAPGGQTTGFGVAPDGSLAIVDRGRQHVIRFDATGGPLAEWGPGFGSGTDAVDLNGIAASGTDWYLLDRGGPRILQLDATGRATHTIDLQPLATYGPNGLAIDARGDVYLADTGGNRILVFNSGGSLIRTIGTAGAGLGQLKQPIGLSFGPDGAMFVSDFENNRIERFDAALQPTNAWPLTGHAFGVAVDGLGRVFVPDAEHDMVRMFSAQGDLLAELGGQAPDALGISAPVQVGLTPDGAALWVVGTDGLARVDLSTVSQIVPPSGSRGTPLPLGAAGGVLVALALAPLAWRTLARRDAHPLPLGEGWGEGHVEATESHAREEPSPGLGPVSSTPRGRGELLVTRRARITLAIGLVLFTTGTAGVVLAQIYFAGPTARSAPWAALALEIASGLVWAAGCAVSARALPLAWVADWPDRMAAAPRRGHAFTRPRMLMAGGAVVLGGLAAGMWYAGRFETAEATRTMLVWLFALALAVGACTRAPFGLLRRPALLTLIPPLLFFLALAPRLWQLADLPYGIWFDEAQGALEVRRVTDQGTYTPILNTYGKDTSGFFYLMPALSVVLSDKDLAARSAAALVGALTAPATYLLGRELFGWRVGLAAGIVLAFLRWHLNFSRLGFNPVSLPLCATLAFWLLARAVRRKSWSDVAWAGLALGVGLHAYTGFRGMPVVALVALAAAAVFYRWSPTTLLPRFGVYLGAAALAALPVIVFAVQDPTAFNGRTAQTLITTQSVSDAEKLRQIWDTLQRHALMFNVSGDMNGRHNLPGAPMLDSLTAGLVVLGLGWLLMRPRDWRTFLLLAWSAVAMSGGILTLAFEAPQAVRTFGVTPVLAVLAGLGLVASLDRLVAVVTLPRIVRAWRATVAVAALGAVALAWIGFTNLDTYFNRQMRDADVFGSFSTRETVPAKAALAGQGRYATILASTTMTPSVEAAFLVPDLQATIRPFDPGGDLPYRGPGPGLVFLETEHDQALADEVARMYPDAIRQPVRAPSGGKAIVEGFRLEPDVLAAHRGVQATYRGADGATTVVSEARPEFDPTGGSPVPPVALPADVTWQGGMGLETTGEYSFRAPSDFELRIDDQLLSSAAGAGVRVRLVRGSHAIRLSGRVESGRPAALEWRPPGARQWQPIAAEALFIPPPGGLGLQLTLWPALDAGTQPAEGYVDPVLSHFYHVSPFARLHLDPPVWAAEWVGQLDAPDSGTYGLLLDYSQTAGVWIDDRQILGNLNGLPDIRNAILAMTSGRHAIRVRYEKTVEGSPWITLSWTPPGAPPAVVPGSALFAPPPVVLGPAQ
jgi:DNA-binding beta-propeller fold protein YncE/4-amino-4-deoxy-L-arabinose transferase-like glycosyltransferase